MSLITDSTIEMRIIAAPQAKLLVIVSIFKITDTIPVITAAKGDKTATAIGFICLIASVLRSQQIPTENSPNNIAGIIIFGSKENLNSSIGIPPGLIKLRAMVSDNDIIKYISMCTVIKRFISRSFVKTPVTAMQMPESIPAVAHRSSPLPKNMPFEELPRPLKTKQPTRQSMLADT